jgi:hypothetical protein
MMGMAGSVVATAAPSVGSRVHRKSLIGFRAACHQMWGSAGYAQLCRDLPPDVSERTAGMRPLPEWVSLEDLIAWHVAVWNGPAGRDERVFAEHVRATVDQGFGRVKRFLISMSTPHSLAARVVSLWSDEYSTGRLEGTLLEEKSVHLMLSEHAYIDTALMRSVIAEVFRYVVSLTKAKNVTAVHAVRDSSLVVVLRWTST